MGVFWTWKSRGNGVSSVAAAAGAEMGKSW